MKAPITNSFNVLASMCPFSTRPHVHAIHAGFRALALFSLLTAFFLLIPVARAQNPRREPARSDITRPIGWNSFANPRSGVTGYSLIAMTDQSEFESSELLRPRRVPSASLSTPVERRNEEDVKVLTSSVYREFVGENGAIDRVSVLNLENVDTPRAPLMESDSLVERDRAHSGSLLYSLQHKYEQWQSSLADSRSLVGVSGSSVYPLLQINFAGTTLPVSLHVSPSIM
jgi:hypothetical protein